MRLRNRLLTGVMSAVLLALPSVASADSLINIGGNTANVNPAICANVISTGGCTTASTSTTTPTTGSSGNSLVNVSGNNVNVNPAVCVNALTNANCTASSGASTTPVTTGGVLGAVTTVTNGLLVSTGGGLINVTGNAVNVNPAVCANVLATGGCASTTTTTPGCTNCGGGVLGASTETPNVGGSVLGAVTALPKTGSASWLVLVLSAMGAGASAVFASRKKFGLII